ncbi:MAG: Hsp20/alpha crystallin family protein [Candidatus Aureabacteria bacterium]|nr:Hsp20/alpha crystallin family protein [Candidatus Auribacterota bacterium]
MKLVPWRRQDSDFFFKPLADFRQEFDRLFDRFFDRELVEADGGFTPKIELSEDEKSYTVKAELPGLEEKDVDVSLEDNVLTIKGEKKEEKEEKKGKNAYYRETRYGSFFRQIPLRQQVQEDKVKAKFKKGILTLDLPKKEVTKSKSIKINVE